MFDFPTVLSKFLLLGMPLGQVVGCGTSQAAAAMPAFKGLGTLAAGAEADVAVFELGEGDFEFVDNERTVRRGTQKLIPFATIVKGRKV